MKMYKIYQKISAITTRGGTWKYNLTTGESEFIKPQSLKLKIYRDRKLNANL